MFFRSVLFSLFTLAVATLPARAQQTGSDIQVGGVFSAKEIPVTVEANDAQVGALARAAFSAHGAYRVVASGNARIQLRKVSDTSIAVTCQSGGAQTEQTVSGGDWVEATLRACDAAVVVTGRSQNLRPFFAGRLAFVSDRTGKKEIYSSDLFLQSVRPLTNLNSISITPHWVRGGQEVLFTTYHNNNFTDIYAVNVASRQLRDVVVGVRGTTIGAVSNPVNGDLAFASSARGNMDIYTANASGKNTKALARTDGVESDPSWAVNGSELYFTSGPNGRPSIHVIGTSGGTPRRIATPGYGYATEPAANPVETGKIAFTFQRNGVFGIGIVDTRTGEVKAITKAGSFMHPTWCADGRHLVATQVAGQANSLVLLDSETGKTARLSPAQMANCTEADYLAAP